VAGGDFDLRIEKDLNQKSSPRPQPLAGAIKAHPTERAGSRGYAQAQRDYFQDCIAKGGNMPDVGVWAS
jgi:hypothetical protein